MSYIVFAWIATIASGISLIISKLTSKYSIPNPLIMNFLIVFFAAIFTIPLALFNHVGLPTDLSNIFLAAFFNILFLALFYFALYRLDVTTISPLFNLRGVFGVLLGIFFIHEVINIQQIIFIAVIIISSIFVTLDEKLKLSSFLKPAVLIMISATLALALNGFFINKAAIHNNYWQLYVWINIVSFIILIPLFPFIFKELKKLKIQQILVTALIASIGVVYTLTANKAYSSNVGITSVIISLPASMVISFILSIVQPKLLEKHTLKVYIIRFAATGIMVYAALLLSH
ncbi:MAG: EamA family transporter [bacterium]|nr:EamA family transporter [bacterium]